MAKYTGIVVSNNGMPHQFESDDKDAMLAELYQELINAKSGWCYIMLDGSWYQVSEPIQKFVLKGPEGKTLELVSGKEVYPADNRFFTLSRTADLAPIK